MDDFLNQLVGLCAGRGGLLRLERQQLLREFKRLAAKYEQKDNYAPKSRPYVDVAGSSTGSFGEHVNSAPQVSLPISSVLDHLNHCRLDLSTEQRDSAGHQKFPGKGKKLNGSDDLQHPSRNLRVPLAALGLGGIHVEAIKNHTSTRVNLRQPNPVLSDAVERSLRVVAPKVLEPSRSLPLMQAVSVEALKRGDAELETILEGWGNRRLIRVEVNENAEKARKSSTVPDRSLQYHFSDAGRVDVYPRRRRAVRKR